MIILDKLIPEGINIPFFKYRAINYGISICVTFLAIGCFLVKGLNYGIDFKGGIMMEVQTSSNPNLSDLRTTLNALKIGEVSLQQFGAPRDIMIRVERQEGDEKAQMGAVEKIREALGNSVEVRRVEMVGPKMGKELIENGFMAIGWSLLAMLIYIWFRFEWQFGVCAILALLHDAFAVLGLYSIFRVEFNTTAIVAILITIGYSINDTVVIYDRIRENLRKYKKLSVPDLINRSINETLSRTILTSGSTLLALFALYFFGGEVIGAYSLPIILGVIVGTYSSICISAPLLHTFNLEVRNVIKDKISENSDQVVLSE